MHCEKSHNTSIAVAKTRIAITSHLMERASLSMDSVACQPGLAPWEAMLLLCRMHANPILLLSDRVHKCIMLHLWNSLKLPETLAELALQKAHLVLHFYDFPSIFFHNSIIFQSFIPSILKPQNPIDLPIGSMWLVYVLHMFAWFVMGISCR